MEVLLYIIAGVIGLVVVIFLGIAAMFAKFYKKVEQGKALIVNKVKKEPIVTFTGAAVWPIIHKGEIMDISVKTIEIDRKGQEGLICNDNIRADIKVNFFVRVNYQTEDVLKVAQAIGCARASDIATLEELFSAKFSEALKTVGKQMDFEDLYKERENFKNEIIRQIGTDLNGYALEDVAIDYLEQTSVDSLDPKNILDSKGIKKITEITTGQNVLTNDLRQTERREIKKQNVQADKDIFELEKQRAEAEATQKKEIANVQAKQMSETQVVAAQERKEAEKARIKAEEEISIDEENKQRQIEVAQKNRERIVGIEHEKVEKDRMLEAINRERETDVKRIEKEQELEKKKKSIADTIRERIAVEKNVAEEEEGIKDLRALADATRTKDVVRITAEGEAQEKLVKEIKAAEAQEQVARHDAKRRLTIADAALEAADKEAKAKIRLSEGVQAEEAASGLAQVKVKEADAIATEKQGLAHVRVKEADAGAVERQGLATVTVKEADADATKKLGMAEAEVLREKHLAEATGEQEKGLAIARVKEAEAAALEKHGVAEALGIEKRGEAEAVGVHKLGEAEAIAVKEKLLAEAAGLAEKADAMKALDGVGREHEEFRLNLDKEKEVELESIRIRQSVAQAQASILAEAFSHAKLNIVGGDGEFFDRFVKAVTFGQSVDATVDNSDSLRSVVSGYLEGKSSLPEDIKEVLTKPSVSAEGIQRLSLSALLGKLALGVGGEERGKIHQLIEKAKELGIDDFTTP